LTPHSPFEWEKTCIKKDIERMKKLPTLISR
jgi:hypothetical protein